jgi:FkbM family methyltransferase
MNYQVKALIQSFAGRLGYQIRRQTSGASESDPYAEQQRLLRGQPVRTIFEVGAADGRDTAVYARDYPEALVFAFEPLPNSFAKLKIQAEACPRIRPYQAAVSGISGTARFHVGTWEDASSLLPAQQTGSVFDQYHKPKAQIDVQTLTLDEVAEANGVGRIDILKMDAQGAELDILKGASRLLGSGSIGVVFTEVHFMESYAGAPLFHEIMGTLVNAGFRLHNFYDLVSNHDMRLAWGDALFIHESMPDTLRS